MLTRTVPTSSEVQLGLPVDLWKSQGMVGWRWGAQIKWILLEACIALRWLQNWLWRINRFCAVTSCSNHFGCHLSNRLELKLGYGHEQSDETFWGSALMILMIIRCVVMRPARWVNGWNAVELAWDSRWEAEQQLDSSNRAVSPIVSSQVAQAQRFQEAPSSAIC